MKKWNQEHSPERTLEEEDNRNSKGPRNGDPDEINLQENEEMKIGRNNKVKKNSAHTDGGPRCQVFAW